MKKILVFLILGSLITGCQTTTKPATSTMTDKVNKIKVIVEYYGDLTGKNKGVKQKTVKQEVTDAPVLGIVEQPKIVYLVDVYVAPQATMAEFITAFHTATGLDHSYKAWGGVPPHRSSYDVLYTHVVNKTMVTTDNEQLTLPAWNIQQNSNIILEITGGGMVD